MVDLQNDTKYNFLSTDKELNNKILFLGITGSNAYNIATDSSDLDLRGIKCSTPREILCGLDSDKVYSDKNTDTVIYPIKRVFDQLKRSSPAMLEMFALTDDLILQRSKEYDLIKDSIGLFLTKQVAESYFGFARSQLAETKSQLSGCNLDIEFELQSIKSAIKKLALAIPALTDSNIGVYLDSNEIKFSFNNINDISIEDTCRLGTEISSIHKTYKRKLMIKKNKPIDKLYKHFECTVRYLKQGIDILEGKGLSLVPEYTQLLLDIRNQRYSIDDILDLINDDLKLMTTLSKTSSLPDTYNKESVSDLIYTVYSSIIERHS